ncbi:hypothetical protein J3454_03755 [Erythrobacter sp. NFXS35]|uniref:hypothetical protein n=1 Tax=Erythrobacter sp. NFXS35 TaxID=2818436 RepID=UPI0032DE2DF6
MSGINPDRADPDPGDVPEAPFDSGCLGCLFVLMVPIAVLGGIAAFSSDFAGILADTGARRNPVGVFRIGPIDIGALLFAGIATWEAVKAARRFVDRRAVWIEGDMIRFHPTVRRHPLPLHALTVITHEAGEIKSILWLEHGDGKRIKIAMVDQDAARAFVAEAERARAALTFG